MLTTECLNICIYCLYCFIYCNICISDKDVFYEIVRLRKQMSLARLGYVWPDRLSRLGYVWPDRLARLGYVWPDRLPLACCDELLWWQPCSFQQLTDLSGCWWSEIFTSLPICCAQNTVNRRCRISSVGIGTLTTSVYIHVRSHLWSEIHLWHHWCS